MKMLLGNLDRLAAEAASDDRIACFRSRARGRATTLWTLFRACWFDMVVINGAPKDLLLFAAWKAAFPFARYRLISVDVVLPVPPTHGMLARLRLGLKRHLMKKVHAFIQYSKDYSGYEKYYGIGPEKWIFIPFKVNHYEDVCSTDATDEGFVFCGGKSRRDFQTLIKSMTRLPYPLVIASEDNEEIRKHESFLDEDQLPPNVTVVRDRHGAAFVETMARSRIVVNPIKANNITSAGISVVLPALALGKCVVMTECPATRGYLDKGQLVTVPPEDEDALAREIERLWEDEVARRAVEERAAAFATQLRGEQQLYANLYRELVGLWQGDSRRWAVE